MIVIACHNTAVDFIHPCVASIRKHMPLADVCIVDSASPDKSYMTDIDAVVLDVNNRHYEAGAWWTAFKTFLNEPFFYFLHDSVILQAPLDAYREHDLWVPGYLDGYGGCSEIHRDLIPQWMARTTYPTDIPDRFFGPFGNMFFCRRTVLDRLAAHGVDQLLPTNKRETEAMERVWGICFKHEGFDVPTCSWGLSEKLAMERNELPLRKYYGRRA